MLIEDIQVRLEPEDLLLLLTGQLRSGCRGMHVFPERALLPYKEKRAGDKGKAAMRPSESWQIQVPDQRMIFRSFAEWHNP